MAFEGYLLGYILFNLNLYFMKTLKKLKLNQISKTNLEQQELGKLSGGCLNCGVEIWPSCGCGCLYAHENKGSSTSDNGARNSSGGLYS